MTALKQMMMIMQADRQDFDDVTGQMIEIINFIGQTLLCKQKTSQNKQIPVCPHMIKHYVRSRSRLHQWQGLVIDWDYNNEQDYDFDNILNMFLIRLKPFDKNWSLFDSQPLWRHQNPVYLPA